MAPAPRLRVQGGGRPAARRGPALVSRMPLNDGRQNRDDAVLPAAERPSFLALGDRSEAREPGDRAVGFPEPRTGRAWSRSSLRACSASGGIATRGDK